MFENAILIPGGGLNPDGTPHVWIKECLNKAVELYGEKSVIIPLSRGTIYKPPVLDKNGFPVYESTAAAIYLLEKGIPSDNLRIETQSLDTIGNAYFSKLIFIKPMHITDITVISTDFHMPRVRFCFEWIYQLHPREVYNINFLTIPNEGMSTEMLESRKLKESERLKEIQKIAQNISDDYSFSMWLFRHHKAYSLGDFASDVSLNESTLQTY